MNWCILIPALVGIISAILGYLLGKLLGGGGNHDDCKNKIARLEAELEACKTSKASLEADLKSANKNVPSSSFAATTAPVAIAFNAAAAKAVYGKTIKEDDLTVIEGIGPKIQELFHNHNVKTWKALSECSVEKCQSVLDSGGQRFKVHKPKTWPIQAKMAYEGQWEALLKWQDELDGGK